MKTYSFNRRNDGKNIFNGISKSHSKIIKFEEYDNCSNGKRYEQENDILKIRSINHEIYPQRVSESSLSPFDEKRCLIKETESNPWN